MSNKIDVYACVGSNVYLRFAVSTAPLSETEQKENHYVVLDHDAVQKLRDKGDSYFVYNTRRHRVLRENENYYYCAMQPYMPDYAFALIEDVLDAYEEAAYEVQGRTDARCGVKVWVRLAKRVAFGVAEVLTAWGIASKVGYETGLDKEATRWPRVKCQFAPIRHGDLHFSFDPLSVMHQRMAMGDGAEDAVLCGHDVLLYPEGSRTYIPVVTFSNLLRKGTERKYTLSRSASNGQGNRDYAHLTAETVIREMCRWVRAETLLGEVSS